MRNFISKRELARRAKEIYTAEVGAPAWEDVSEEVRQKWIKDIRGAVERVAKKIIPRIQLPPSDRRH